MYIVNSHRHPIHTINVSDLRKSELLILSSNYVPEYLTEYLHDAMAINSHLTIHFDQYIIPKVLFNS